MKVRNIFAALLLLSVIISRINAQQQQPGTLEQRNKDSIECIKKISAYKEFVGQQLYEFAYDPWKEAFSDCRSASKNIYIDGIKLYKYFLTKVGKNKKRKEELIDTIMLIYDRRIQYYGNDKKYPEGYVLGLKGIDMLALRKDKIEEVYQCFKKSLNLMKETSEPAVLLSFMQANVGMIKEKRIDTLGAINNYVLISDYLSQKLLVEKNAAEKEKITKSIEGVDALLVDIIKTENNQAIVKIFEKRYKEAPDDINNLKKIASMLDKLNCTSNDIYVEICEKIYKQEPNAASARYLAKIFYKKDNFNKALEYYNKVIESEQDNELKAKDLFELASTCSKLNKNQQAKNYALEALKLKENWGDPYLLIGLVYAAASNECGSDDFQKKAVYWAAVDKFIKAKTVDPSKTEEADKLIALYKKYFPDNESVFFQGLKDNAGFKPFKINCWINESPLAREK